MIISDLSHLEVISEGSSVAGGVSISATGIGAGSGVPSVDDLESTLVSQLLQGIDQTGVTTKGASSASISTRTGTVAASAIIDTTPA